MSGSVRGRTWRAARPVVATPSVVAFTTGVLFVLGGLLVLLGTCTAWYRLEDLGTLRAVGALAVVIGSAVTLARRRLPAGASHLLVLTGTGLITTIVHDTAGTSVGVALASLYVLVALDSAFFFSWPGAVAHLASVVVSCAYALWPAGPAGTGATVLVAGTSLLAAGVVGWLVRRAAEAELDALTGLLNRRGLDRLLDEAVDEARRTGSALSLALLDLDHFKKVNDGLGHGEGDALLADTARRWQALLGPGQVLARQGGDEFVLVLPGRALAQARDAVEALRGVLPPGRTASAGVAEWDPAESLSLLLSSADGALYEAKRAGRDRTRSAGHTASSSAELRRAMRDGELVVHYQPVLDLGTRRVVAAEALVRWQHPQSGLLLPGAFLPPVEGTEVMVDLGTYVLADACRQVARWRRVGGPPVVTVNVSGPELLDGAHVGRVQDALLRAGLPGEALVLEVTESLTQSRPVVDVLHGLRALGVRIALDDFGTGWSSLGRLGQLPLDALKIDRSLVQDVPADAAGAPLLQAVVAMADALGLHVVAEGVEQPHQDRLLSALGCQAAQGFLYGRAVPAEELVASLDEEWAA